MWGQPDPDAAIMQGGPLVQEPAAAPTPDPTPDPTFETVRLGGLELEVDPQTKAAIEAELSRLQQPAAAPPPAPAAPAPPLEPTSPLAGIKDLNTRIFTEPDAVLAELYQVARENISNELRGEYSRNQTEQEFWSTFYADNEDLAPNKFLVKSIVERERAALGNLQSLPDIARHIADTTRAELLRIKGAESQTPSRPRAVMRGSQAGGRSPTPPAVAPSNVTSVTQILRQRHAKRMGGGG